MHTIPPIADLLPQEDKGKGSSPLAGEEGARRAAVGRRGGQRNLLSLARRMRHEPTQAEARLWSMLRGRRMAGYKFKRQEQIGDYVVDFVCFERRLIVEADGSQHANGADARRDAWLAAQGFSIVRLWNTDILTNPEGVAAAIIAALAPPLPDPLPQGERGNEERP